MSDFLGIPGYTVVGRAETAIHDFVVNLLDKAAKIYHHLEENEQLVSNWASGVIATINANLKLVPDVVFTLLQVQFPTLTKEYLQEMLIKGANFITKANGLIAVTWYDAMTTIQNYLSVYEGNEWAIATKSVVTALVAIFVPGTTAIQKIEQALEYVYKMLVKPKVIQLVPVEPPVQIVYKDLPDVPATPAQEATLHPGFDLISKDPNGEPVNSFTPSPAATI